MYLNMMGGELTPQQSVLCMDVSVNAQPAKDGDDALSGLHILYQISLNKTDSPGICKGCFHDS